MVTPVNTDKPITPSTERSSLSQDGKTDTQAAGRRSDTDSLGTTSTEPKPDVDNARQLYQLENNPLENLRTGPRTPEEARSLLNQILQQLTTTPEAAMKSHAVGSSSLLGNLLTAAPT